VTVSGLGAGAASARSGGGRRGVEANICELFGHDEVFHTICIAKRIQLQRYAILFSLECGEITPHFLLSCAELYQLL
jgi:hypothetical protein